MTPQEFKAARERLGLTQREIGVALGIAYGPDRAVRRYEAGDSKVNGPIEVALRYMLRHGLDKEAQRAIRMLTNGQAQSLAG